MQRSTRLVAGAAVVAALAGGGAAVAAGDGGLQAEQDAVLNDAAKRLGVQPADLDAALTEALSARIDAAVAAGTLSKERGAELEQRLADGDAPLVGLPGAGHGLHGPGFPGGLEAAAEFLGLTTAELRAELADGNTLAEVAKGQGKTAAALRAALLAAARQDLAAAVRDGRLTESQRQELLDRLPERIADLVDRSFDGHRLDDQPPAGSRGGGFDA